MFSVNIVIQHVGKLSLGQQCTYQALRWYRTPRKPFWLGLAKSKQFIVPQRPTPDPVEYKALRQLFNIYRTNRKSLRHFMLEQASRENSTQGTQALITDADIEESLKLNEAFNAESAKKRDARLHEMQAEREVRVLEEIEKKNMIQASIYEKATNLVKAEKEKSKTFITRDNIDKAIDDSLATIVDFNFAIDLEGKIYPNDSLVGHTPTEEEKETLHVKN